MLNGLDTIDIKKFWSHVRKSFIKELENSNILKEHVKVDESFIKAINYNPYKDYIIPYDNDDKTNVINKDVMDTLNYNCELYKNKIQNYITAKKGNNDSTVKIYKKTTVPFYKINEDKINDSSSFENKMFLTKLSYDMDVKNISRKIGDKYIIIVVHFVYKTNVSYTTKNKDEMICGELKINYNHFGRSINFNLGECLNNTIDIPHIIIQAMKQSEIPLNKDNINGAIQFIIFIEEGLIVSDVEGINSLWCEN